MEVATKRKRDVDIPRITYDAATRTFDRLFKEDTLEGMKDVVRKKLGVSAYVPVHLSQLRDGRSVDLEDDDDFEAFQSAAYSALVARVKVVLGEGQNSISPNKTVVQSTSDETTSTKARKEKKKDSNGHSGDTPNRHTSEPPVTSSRNSPDDTTPPPPSKKRRVSFAEPSSEPPTEFNGLVKKKKKKESKNTESDDEPSAVTTPPKKRQSEDNPEAVLEVDQPKPRSEKEKKDKLKEGSRKSRREKEQDTGRSEKKKQKRSAESSILEDETPAEDIRPAKDAKKSKKSSKDDSATLDESKDKKSKKRARTASPTRSEEVSLATKLSFFTAVELPALPEDTEHDVRPTKKSKQQHALGEEDAPATEKKSSKKDQNSKQAVVNVPEIQPTDATTKSSKPKSTADTPAAVRSTDPSKSAKDSFLAKDKPVEKGSKKSKDTLVAVENEPSAPANLSAQKHVVADELSEKSLPAAAEPKPPKKPSKKKADNIEQPDAAQEKFKAKKSVDDAKEIAKVAIAAILASSTKPVSTAAAVGPTDPPPNVGAASVIVTNSSKESTTTQVEPSPSTSANGTSTPAAHEEASKSPTVHKPKSAKPSKPKPPPACPVCDEEPFHVRTKCPVIKAGIKSMRKRIAELEKESSDDKDHSAIIAELQVLIDKRSRKPKVIEVTKSVSENVENTSDNTRTAVTEGPSVDVLVTTQPPPAPTQQPPTTQPLVSATPQPPATQPPPSTQPRRSTQPPPPMQVTPSIQASSSQRAVQKSKVAEKDKDLLKPSILGDISLSTTGASLGAFANKLLGLDDVSSYTERDLEALIRGPRLSLNSKNLPSPDTSDEEEEEEDVVLEEDVIEEDRRTKKRNASQNRYPSSSDEGADDDDSEEEEPEESPLPDTRSALDEESVSLKRPVVESTSTSADERGNRSFHEVDERGSSREIDGTGDAAVNDAISADIGLLERDEQGQEEDSDTDEDSDTAVPQEEKSQSPEMAAKAVSLPPPTVELPQTAPVAAPAKQAVDPIEPVEVDVSRASQPDFIESDDEEESMPPAQSTPKMQVIVRLTRSSKTKPVTDTAADTAKADKQPANGAEKTPKIARKTRSLTKISELPIPILPTPSNSSIRVIKAAPTPTPATTRTTRAKASQETNNADDEATPPPSQPPAAATRGRKAAVAPKTPAKTPAKATRVSVKPVSKAQPKLSSQTTMKPPAMPVGKAPISAKEILAGRTATRASRLAADLESERDDEGNDDAPSNALESPVSWSLLPEKESLPTDQSQVDSNETQVDELNSSPRDDAQTQGGQGLKASDHGASQEPLFVHSESQQDFPYSQYLGLDPPDKNVSPHDSDDEDEVEAAVIKSTKHSRQSATFRSLTEIASQSQRVQYAPRYSSQLANLAKPPVQDMYGLAGQDADSEESESDSDSDGDDKPLASHIPAARRAGVSSSKRK